MIQINGEKYKLILDIDGKVVTYDVAIPANVTLDFQDKGKKTVTWPDGVMIKGGTLEEIYKSLGEFYEEVDRMRNLMFSYEIHSFGDEYRFFSRLLFSAEQVKDYETSDSGVDCKYLKSAATKLRKSRESIRNQEQKLMARGMDYMEIEKAMLPKLYEVEKSSRLTMNAIKKEMLF